MVRKVFIICLFVLPLVLGMSICIKAALAEGSEPAFQIDLSNIEYDNSPANKLGRGLINTATCWAEVPGEVARVSKEKDPLIGFTLGLAQGVMNTIIRGAVGIYDTLTCVIPPYNKPELQPEYALQSADESFREYLW